MRGERLRVNVADGWARLVNGRRGKWRSGERRARGASAGLSASGGSGRASWAGCCAREAGRSGKVGRVRGKTGPAG